MAQKNTQCDHYTDNQITFPCLERKNTTLVRQEVYATDIFPGNPVKTKTVSQQRQDKSGACCYNSHIHGKIPNPDESISAQHDTHSVPEYAGQPDQAVFRHGRFYINRVHNFLIKKQQKGRPYRLSPSISPPKAPRIEPSPLRLPPATGAFCRIRSAIRENGRL